MTRPSEHASQTNVTFRPGTPTRSPLSPMRSDLRHRYAADQIPCRDAETDQPAGGRRHRTHRSESPPTTTALRARATTEPTRETSARTGASTPDPTGDRNKRSRDVGAFVQLLRRLCRDAERNPDDHGTCGINQPAATTAGAHARSPRGGQVADRQTRAVTPTPSRGDRGAGEEDRSGHQSRAVPQIQPAGRPAGAVGA